MVIAKKKILSFILKNLCTLTDDYNWLMDPSKVTLEGQVWIVPNVHESVPKFISERGMYLYRYLPEK